MKRLSFALFCMALPCVLQAQEAEKKQNNHEIGIDITTLIHSLLPNEQEGIGRFFLQSHFLTYKQHFGTMALRIGAGGNLQIEEVAGGYNSNTDYTDRRHGANLRIGWEFQQMTWRKLMVYYGGDFVGSYNYSAGHYMGTQHGRPGWITITTTYGAGPILGIQWWLTQKISIATESSFYFTDTKAESHSQHIDTPENDVHGSRRVIRGIFNPPLFLYFTFKF